MIKKVLIIPILFLIVFAMFFPVLEVYAANCSACGLDINTEHYDNGDCQKCPLCNGVHNYKAIDNNNALWVYNIACSAYTNVFKSQGTPGYDKLASTNVENQAKINAASLIAFSTDGVFQGAFDTIESSYNSLTLLGSILVMIYFLMELAEIQMNDGFTKEELAKLCIKGLLGFTIISNGYDILLSVLNQCSTIVQSLASYDIVISDTTSCVGTELQKANIFGKLGVALRYGLPYITATAAYIIIRVICWTRIFDILIRMTFAPIGMADFIRGGANSNAVRYLKKLFASVFQGACIIGTLICYQVISSTIMDSISGYLGAVLVSLALITAIRQTGRIANEIIGV